MKTMTSILIVLFLAGFSLYADGYQVGDKAEGFSLKNVDGSMVSLADYPDAKGFVVIFTCNGCPYAKAYQDRIIDIDKKFKTRGYPVIAINPNDVDIKPDDSLEEMKKRSGEKGFTFPYLKDESQEVYRTYGAVRTPHVFVLQKVNGDLIVKYIGAIDNNYQDASKADAKYLEDALTALIDGKDPDPSFTKAIGCSIKSK